MKPFSFHLYLLFKTSKASKLLSLCGCFCLTLFWSLNASCLQLHCSTVRNADCCLDVEETKFTRGNIFCSREEDLRRNSFGLCVVPVKNWTWRVSELRAAKITNKTPFLINLCRVFNPPAALGSSWRSPRGSFKLRAAGGWTSTYMKKKTTFCYSNKLKFIKNVLLFQKLQIQMTCERTWINHWTLEGPRVSINLVGAWQSKLTFESAAVFIKFLYNLNLNDFISRCFNSINSKMFPFIEIALKLWRFKMGFCGDIVSS